MIYSLLFGALNQNTATKDASDEPLIQLWLGLFVEKMLRATASLASETDPEVAAL